MSDGNNFAPACIYYGRVRQGFHTPLRYVLTQLPLADTVGDFWRLVVEERCNTVVMLDAVGSDDVRRAEYCSNRRLLNQLLNQRF